MISEGAQVRASGPFYPVSAVRVLPLMHAWQYRLYFNHLFSPESILALLQREIPASKGAEGKRTMFDTFI